jgi:threonine/homoserine/homoserine lactone efflux protein
MMTPPLDAIAAVSLAGLALSATPGPSMLYVLSRSVGQGRAAGLASAVGLCLGGILLAIATAMGLAVLFGRFPWLVTGLRYAGSAYLIWLGVSLIRNARPNAEVALEAKEVTREPLSSIMWQGILVELLNPKTVLFFALFLPPFVSASVGHPTEEDMKMQLLLLGIIVPLTAIPSDILVAFMGGTIARAISRATELRQRMAWFSGLILIAIALNLHLGLI